MKLLFDDDAIDRTAGVRRVLGSPKKEPDPILEPQMPWETAGSSAFHAVLRDRASGRFRLWYRASIGGADRPAGEGDGPERHFLCYAESGDGLTWDRPALRRLSFAGSLENNIIREVDAGDTVFHNIVEDPDDPDPRRRYKALGYQHTTRAAAGLPEGGGAGVTVSFSRNGLEWPEEPILVMGFEEITDANCLQPYRDRGSGSWVAFLRPRTQPKRRFVGRGTSGDFLRWTHPEMLLTPDSGDDEFTEFYSLSTAVVGTFHVGALWVFHDHPEDSPMTTELVYSRGGRSFHRALPRAEWIPRGPEGSFDSGQVCPVRLLPVGEELFVYYNGVDRHHRLKRGPKPPVVNPKTVGATRRTGLARLPLQALCGLRADHDGVVETRWVCNYGQTGVQAVADVDPGGSVRAEILDPFGSVVPGWDRAASGSVAAADGRLRLWWERPELRGIPGQTSDAGGTVGHVMKVRFHLHRATLFGFQVGEETSFPGQAP